MKKTEKSEKNLTNEIKQRSVFVPNQLVSMNLIRTIVNKPTIPRSVSFHHRIPPPFFSNFEREKVFQNSLKNHLSKKGTNFFESVIAYSLGIVV